VRVVLTRVGVLLDGDGEVWRVHKSTDPALEATVLFATGGPAPGAATRRLEPISTTLASEPPSPATRLRETLPDGTTRLWTIHANTFQRDLFPAAAASGAARGAAHAARL
jgi:hypothetical protein